MNKELIREELRFNFLIHNLDKLNKSALQSYLKDSNLDYSIKKNKKIELLVIKDIDKFFNSDFILGAISRFQIDKMNYEIFIKVTTDYSPLYLELPKVIKDIYRKIGCKMRISFILDY